MSRKHRKQTFTKVAYMKGQPVFQKITKGRKRCTGKLIYSEAEANEVADKIFFSVGKLLRTYRCHGNDHYHLTSKVGRSA